MRKKRRKKTKNKSKTAGIPDDLLFILGIMGDSDLPETDLLSLLHDSVSHYNVKNDTKFDPKETVLAWSEGQK